MSLTPYQEAELGKVFVKYIQDAISKTIKEVIEQEIEKAKKEVENVIREKTAMVAMKAASHYSLERFGSTIRIDVQLPDKQK